jgi:hypothetical protein
MSAYITTGGGNSTIFQPNAVDTLKGYEMPDDDI